LRSAFRYHNIWPSCVQTIARGSMVGVDVTHVLPTPHRIGGDIPQNVQLRRLRTTIATTACGDSVSNTRVRVKLAAAAPTQRRRRPLADEYKCKEQGRGHTRAYGNARRVSRHSLRPHVEPDFESPTTRNAKQVQVIEVQAHQRHENITTWRKNEAQVASRPISNCPTETDFRTQTVCD